MSTPLNRTTYPVAAPPVRLVHLGLGAFHRAHQVWYTQQADPGWGYASFTGRSARMSDLLSAQDGLFTLITRSGEGDTPEVISALVEAQPADNLTRLVELVADPQVAVITCTITEAGYHLTGAGALDTEDPQVIADIAALRAGQPANLATAAGRIVAGLRARHAAGHGGLAVMSCDNIAANGEKIGRAHV